MAAGRRRAARLPGSDKHDAKRKVSAKKSGRPVPFGPVRPLFVYISGLCDICVSYSRVWRLWRSPSAARAQEPVTGACATPDSIAFRGQPVVTDDRSDGATSGSPRRRQSMARTLTKALKDLYATNQFEDVGQSCEIIDGKIGPRLPCARAPRCSPTSRSTGADKVSPTAVKDRVDLLDRQADRPGAGGEGCRPDRFALPERGLLPRQGLGRYGRVGRGDDARLPRRRGASPRHFRRGDSWATRRWPTKTIVGAIGTKPEGFFWWKNGEFDQDKYAEDLAKTIPELYASHGYIDMQVVKDTLIVDREQGKALVRITVNEGPQYKIGDLRGQRRQALLERRHRALLPVRRQAEVRQASCRGDRGPRREPGQRTSSTRTPGKTPPPRCRTRTETRATSTRAFAQSSSDDAAGPDSTPTVDLRWDIDERTPAIVNRVDIFGNDVTTETCIRNQLFMLPGDVFNKERLIQSYRNIANLGFFEQDMPPPETRQANENGDIDLIFHVKEKRTGNVNFGASVGQGTGVGGFVGFDQPNLFGECKRGSLQWQFGQYIRDFSLSYTDPQIRQSNVSGTVSLYNQQSRFIIRDIGQSNTSGGQLQFGFPLAESRFTRLYAELWWRASQLRRRRSGRHDQLQRLLPVDGRPYARSRHATRNSVPVHGSSRETLLSK